jgi:predicted ATP-dependent endonuclease of OLD family
MRIIKAHVTNFRSAEDSEEFRLDPVTSLVGKNEAGKSAILLALAALNPHPSTPIKLDKERDYPRRFLIEYSQRHKEAEAVAVKTTWQLDDDELQEIGEEFGTSALRSNLVQVSRRYNAPAPEWAFDVDLTAAFNHVFDIHDFDAQERQVLAEAKNTKELIATLEKLGTPTDKHTLLLQRLRGYGSVTTKIQKIVEPYLPQFMYFANYDRMDGAVQIEQLNQLASNGQIEVEQYRGQKLFREFFEYAGVPLSDIQSVQTYETFNARLQGASNRITEQVLEYWTQNPDLEVHVKIEQAKTGDPAPFNTGTIARARIYNQLHKVDTPFSERSAGFVWFFSFLVKFAQVKDDDVPVVLLLDEPGLSLHGTAQADLLRFFHEKLAPDHQIIYSTHSPFMVQADQLLAARIVEDQVKTKNKRRVPVGTKVREDILSNDRDTLFPLQGALGYEITQTLFVGKNTLLVEGPSDILYLKALSSALGKRQRTILRSEWTLCPSGGLGNVRSFVALFGGNKLNIAVLADYADGQKKEIERLRTSEILKSGRVLTVHSFTGKTESDVEDLFEPQLFCDILNSAYNLSGTDKITEKALQAADTTTTRLVKKAEAYFRTKAPAAAGDFDHYKAAEWLMLNPAALDGAGTEITTTLDRAENLIIALNALL